MDKNKQIETNFLSPSSFWIPEWIPDASAWFEHGPFAFWITDVHRPRCLVELGSHEGFSYMAFCQSMQRNQVDGRCYAVDTWKGDKHSGLYGENVFSRVNNHNQKHYSGFSHLIRSTFDQALERFPNGSIDLLHIDGLHTYEAVKHDFESWLPKMSSRGIILFHDTNVRERDFGVWRLWQELTSKYPYFEFFHGHGLGILGVGSELPDAIKNLFAIEHNSTTAENIRNFYARLGKFVALERLQSENIRLREIVESADWRQPEVKARKAGFLRRLERSIRKRRKMIFMRAMYLLSLRATKFYVSSRFADLATPFEPQITIIVPCYNHAAYLRQRLDTIYTQTYQNFRVLLLDDCSSDESQAILKEYAERFPDKTELHLNPVNGGRVFPQWKKGIELAKTNLIWIAESDDFCSRTFLEELVPYFRDEAVQISYGRTIFVDRNGRPIDFTFEGYVSKLDKYKWMNSYVQTAHLEARSALGITNTIPNVSSVLFRNPGQNPLLEDPDWLNMKIAGDWIFYLHLARGGKIAFTPKAVNYYRYHGTNASVSTHKLPIYFREHEMVARTVQRLYDVPSTTLERHTHFLKEHWKGVFNQDFQPEWKLEDEYRTDKIRAESVHRLPNVLIACHSFAGGGSEIFPIRLAMALKEKGFGVTFLDCNRIEGNHFRDLLPSHIPVIQRNESSGDINAIINEFGIEIVHTHQKSIDMHFAENIRRKEHLPKHIVTMHGMYELDNEGAAEYLPALMKNVDHWVYTADKNLEPFKQLGLYTDDRFIKIGLGMNLPKISPVQRSLLKIAADAFVVCVASRAIPEKGWEESIAAVELSRKKTGRAIHLLLIGNGPVYESLSKRALPPHLHLLGFQLNPVDYYAMADLGLIASTYRAESFPMSIVECLMAGRPMVASDIGEIRNMLALSNGRTAGSVFSIVDGKIPVEAVSDAINACALNRDMYNEMSTYAREAANKFDISHAIERYAGLYGKVLGRNKK